MIKQLKKFDIQTTPFIATKNWELLNIQHQDLVILEPYSASVLIEDTEVALEFIDYAFGNPYGLLNTSCDVALEQQNLDPVLYEEGISGSGLFYPDDAKNPSGTYKRLVYQQILRAFYNNYQNPLKVFGLESFDFQTSGMQRYLSSYFKIFTLPQEQFGDKIQEGTVVFVDNSFDDNYVVKDDCQGNLMASHNLFSRIQEVRHFENIIYNLESPNTCAAPVVNPPTSSGVSFTLTASLTASYGENYGLGYTESIQTNPFTMSLNWNDPFNNESGFYIYMATQFDSASSFTSYNFAGSVGPNVTESLVYYNSPFISASLYVVAWNGLGLSEPTNIVNLNITRSYSSADIVT